MTLACALADLDDRKPLHLDVAGVPLALVRDGAVVHALRDECSHAEVPLSEGELTRGGLECWLHGSCFDLRTGLPRSLPATEKVDVFAVVLRDGEVHVDVTNPINC